MLKSKLGKTVEMQTVPVKYAPVKIVHAVLPTNTKAAQSGGFFFSSAIIIK